MRVSIITPTADQPTGLRLLEGYVARQTVQPHEWIVADDGIEPARLTAGQWHLTRPRTAEGGASLAGNLLAALDRVSGDVVAVFEHDDWYRPDHLAVQLAQLQAGRKAAGAGLQRYYNVSVRRFIVMRNVGSALCNTVFTADLIPAMQAACRRALQRGSYGIDRMFWDSLPGRHKGVHATDTVVGIKGLPGRAGLGMGHRPDERPGWRSDPELKQLEAWVGSDVEAYR